MSPSLSESVIVSIPYSGTRYLKEALNISRHIHTHVPPEQIWNFVGTAKKIVVPLRDPADNWKAFARRWPKHKPWDRCIGEYERAWMGMAWFLDMCDLYTITEHPKEVVIIPTRDFPKIDGLKHLGSQDEGDNSHDYNVKHVYKYDFVRRYYEDFE